MSCKRLKFRGSDRVSIYKYSPEVDCFFRVGRFSTDPRLSGGGRRQYEVRQGIIGKTWESIDGTFHINIPKYADNEIRYYRDFLERTGIGGFNVAQLREMRMKPRCFYAYRVVEPDTAIKCAIIVFESTEFNRFSKRELKTLMGSEYGDVLKNLIYRRSVSIPQMLGPDDVA